MSRRGWICPTAVATHRLDRFSNPAVWVKHFQAIHHLSVDVAHGLALLFGPGVDAAKVDFPVFDHEPPVSSPTVDLRKDELLGVSAVGRLRRMSHIRSVGSSFFSERDDSTQRCPQMPSDMTTPRKSSPA